MITFTYLNEIGAPINFDIYKNNNLLASNVSSHVTVLIPGDEIKIVPNNNLFREYNQIFVFDYWPPTFSIPVQGTLYTTEDPIPSFVYYFDYFKSKLYLINTNAAHPSIEIDWEIDSKFIGNGHTLSYVYQTYGNKKITLNIETEEGFFDIFSIADFVKPFIETWFNLDCETQEIQNDIEICPECNQNDCCEGVQPKFSVWLDALYVTGAVTLNPEINNPENYGQNIDISIEIPYDITFRCCNSATISLRTLTPESTIPDLSDFQSKEAYEQWILNNSSLPIDNSITLLSTNVTENSTNYTIILHMESFPTLQKIRESLSALVLIFTGCEGYTNMFLPFYLLSAV